VPANRKVSVAWQIAFTFIPVLNFWAFYRIRKLRKYVLFVVLPVIVVTFIMNFSLIEYLGVSVQPIEREGASIGSDEIWQVRSLDYWYYTAISSLVGFAFQAWSIFLIIVWSRKHNKQFDQPTTPVS